jgi:endonuclease/exonuclease/phosphatase family metal-dependent hydrolase
MAYKSTMKDRLKLRVMTWNLGFSSAGSGFLQSDAVRAGKMVDFVRDHDIDAIGLQEMASRTYGTGREDFDVVDFLSRKDKEFESIHFERTLSLGNRHSFPSGKLQKLNNGNKLMSQDSGLGIWIRHQNEWRLGNLYSDEKIYRPIVEVQRPMPHPLYMVADEESSPVGRDDEDRPVLWARLVAENKKCKNYKIFLLSLHLPTLKDEDSQKAEGDLNASQRNIAQNVLRLAPDQVKSYTVDKLASELRQYYLQTIIFQISRIEEHWEIKNPESKCVFALAGDMNFYHTTESNTDKKQEQQLLEESGFMCAKKEGYTRNRDRLFDNVWVRGTEHIEELKLNDSICQLDENVSDHIPVVADIYLA